MYTYGGGKGGVGVMRKRFFISPLLFPRPDQLQDARSFINCVAGQEEVDGAASFRCSSLSNRSIGELEIVRR